MRVIAELDEHRHAYIFGYVSSVAVSNIERLRFIVDTGSTYTTILSQDTYRLGVDYRKLQKASCWSDTAKGLILPYELPNVTLRLEKSLGSRARVEAFSLKFVHCLPPPDDLNKLHPLSLMHSYSLLGMDVLQFFRNWQYTDTTLILRSSNLKK